MGTLKIITAHQQFKKEAMKKEDGRGCAIALGNSELLHRDDYYVFYVNKFINNELLKSKLIDLIKSHICDSIVHYLEILLWRLENVHDGVYVSYLYPEKGLDTRCKGFFISVICYLVQTYDIVVNIFTDSFSILNRLGSEVYKKSNRP